MTARSIVFAAMCVALAGCKGDTETAASPREPEPGNLGFYCRMALSEHQGPKGQILLKGVKDPFWFSSVRDALTYVSQDIVSEREMAGFWVNDMGQGTWEKPAPGSWIDARTAWFVVGSKMSSGMGGGEAVPFKEKSAAAAFAHDHGGRVTDYAEARQVSQDTDEMPASETPANREGSGT